MSVGQASLRHRTRSSFGDQFEGRTLREALRNGRLRRWCWRVRHFHHAGRLARPVRSSRLDWKGEEPSNMHDGRAASVPITMKLNWARCFLTDSPRAST